MAGQKMELGPTGNNVARNIKRCREADRLNYAELSRKVTDLGRPISPLAIRRIEEGERRVDVDDLMALTVALNVNPNELLLTTVQEGDDDDVSSSVTGAPAGTTAAQAWDWSQGFRLLSNQEGGFKFSTTEKDDGPLDRVARINREVGDALNETMMLGDGGEWEEELRVLLFSANYHFASLDGGEILSLWRIDTDGNGFEVAAVPRSGGDIVRWVNRVKKTVVAIASKSAEAAVVRDDVLKALKNVPDGND
ncbi:helix-turn-helix domain-containing protein [Pseudarthrobacter sp. J1738]|uniref:helix-turn-helix domain-containing protein n=1 Tax=Pseudarthrobacter sp. J1738 TaxID=3420446 RepID=UPI003D2B4C1A